MRNQNLKEYSKDQAKSIVKIIANAKIKSVKGEGTFEVVASTEGIDRMGESILAKGWETERFMKNPVILLGHDYSALPIGAATEVIKEADRLIVKGVFAKTEEGQKARQLYDDGILRAVSVGFIQLERDGNIITKAELLELSFVAVPCNADAGNFSKSVSKKMIADLVASIKMAVPFEETIMAPEDQEWDEATALEKVTMWAEGEDDSEDVVEDPAPEAIDPEEEITIDEDEPTDEVVAESAIDFEKYQEAFAYADDSNLEDTASYKLLHHDVNENGELVVVWLGVMDAMAKLLAQGNGGVPQEELQGVYNHLVKHYEQFGKEAPELKEYTQFELDEIFGKEEDEEEVTEEAKELAESIMKRLEGDVNSLVAAAKLQLAEVIGEIKRDVKSKGHLGQKAGRTLSAKTRVAIENAATSCDTAVKDLKALLKATDAPSDSALEEKQKLLEFARTIDKTVENLIKGLK